MYRFFIALDRKGGCNAAITLHPQAYEKTLKTYNYYTTFQRNVNRGEPLLQYTEITQNAKISVSRRHAIRFSLSSCAG